MGDATRCEAGQFPIMLCHGVCFTVKYEHFDYVQKNFSKCICLLMLVFVVFLQPAFSSGAGDAAELVLTDDEVAAILEQGKPIDMARVYLYAVTSKMNRDITSKRTFTSLADKLYFLCELSWEMLLTDRMSLNYRAFPERLERLFADRVQEEKDLDHWRYDMMGQTMLIRNSDGDYRPDFDTGRASYQGRFNRTDSMDSLKTDRHSHVF